jgi:hypothetical protein
MVYLRNFPAPNSVPVTQETLRKPIEFLKCVLWRSDFYLCADITENSAYQQVHMCIATERNFFILQFQIISLVQYTV